MILPIEQALGLDVKNQSSSLQKLAKALKVMALNLWAPIFLTGLIILYFILYFKILYYFNVFKILKDYYWIQNFQLWEFFIFDIDH